jgi:hypothetical protein
VGVATTTPLPAGALVGFYQTLPGTTEVPYLIEQQPIDPFSRAFVADPALSAASLDYGTFSGSAVSLSVADPTEGASTYRVAASAPLFADGVLTTTVNGATTALSVPTLLAASGAALNTATVTVSQTTAKKYDRGYIIISHDGGIVATAPLDSVLTQSAASSLAISGLPGGSSTTGALNNALYYVSVRVWNSSDPVGKLNRETYPSVLDLSTGTGTSYSLAID